MVDVNGEDASRAFQDFDMFGSKAVIIAYDVLINGKKPNVKKKNKITMLEKLTHPKKWEGKSFCFV